jgi:hypothetical protein
MVVSLEVGPQLGRDRGRVGLEDLDEQAVRAFRHRVGGGGLAADVGHRVAERAQAFDDVLELVADDTEVMEGTAVGGLWRLVVEVDASGADAQEHVARAGELDGTGTSM